MGVTMSCSQKCLNQILRKQPPYNRPCALPVCALYQSSIDQFCLSARFPPDEPILLQDPGKGFCYCCCDCYPASMPLESAPGTFTLLQDLSAGDTLLAAGTHLDWKPNRVDFIAAAAESGVGDALYVVQLGHVDHVAESLLLSVPADHLFLLRDGPQDSLKPVQKLQPGDAVRRADGGLAVVQFVMPAVGHSLPSVQMAGQFDGIHLDGHLLNHHGVVCADYAVQVYYGANQLSPELLHSSLRGSPSPDAGTPEYQALNGSPELDAVLANNGAWPSGTFLAERKQNFSLLAASVPPGLGMVDLTFNRKLDPASAQVTGHYAASPGLVINRAALSDADAGRVRLFVSGLAQEAEYTLTVTGLLSEEGMPLVPPRNHVRFGISGLFLAI